MSWPLEYLLGSSHPLIISSTHYAVIIDPVSVDGEGFKNKITKETFSSLRIFSITTISHFAFNFEDITCESRKQPRIVVFFPMASPHHSGPRVV